MVLPLWKNDFPVSQKLSCVIKVPETHFQYSCQVHGNDVQDVTDRLDTIIHGLSRVHVTTCWYNVSIESANSRQRSIHFFAMGIPDTREAHLHIKCVTNCMLQMD